MHSWKVRKIRFFCLHSHDVRRCYSTRHRCPRHPIVSVAKAMLSKRTHARPHRCACVCELCWRMRVHNARMHTWPKIGRTDQQQYGCIYFELWLRHIPNCTYAQTRTHTSTHTHGRTMSVLFAQRRRRIIMSALRFFSATHNTYFCVCQKRCFATEPSKMLDNRHTAGWLPQPPAHTSFTTILLLLSLLPHVRWCACAHGRASAKWLISCQPYGNKVWMCEHLMHNAHTHTRTLGQNTPLQHIHTLTTQLAVAITNGCSLATGNGSATAILVLFVNTGIMIIDHQRILFGAVMPSSRQHLTSAVASVMTHLFLVIVCHDNCYPNFECLGTFQVFFVSKQMDSEPNSEMLTIGFIVLGLK